MIHPPDLRRVIETTLGKFPPGWDGPDATELLMGTSAHESHLGTRLYQIKGPALGIYQMEPDTHDSLWAHYIKYRPEIAAVLLSFTSRPCSEELVTNLKYSTAMARVQYRPAPAPIPSTLEGRAEYWDVYYNRNPHKGFPEQYIADYRRYVTDRQL